MSWCVFALAFSELNATNFPLKSVGINVPYVTYLLNKRINSVKANLRNHKYRKLYLLCWFKKGVRSHAEVIFVKSEYDSGTQISYDHACNY